MKLLQRIYPVRTAADILNALAFAQFGVMTVMTFGVGFFAIGVACWGTPLGVILSTAGVLYIGMGLQVLSMAIAARRRFKLYYEQGLLTDESVTAALQAAEEQ